MITELARLESWIAFVTVFGIVSLMLWLVNKRFETRNPSIKHKKKLLDKLSGEKMDEERARNYLELKDEYQEESLYGRNALSKAVGFIIILIILVQLDWFNDWSVFLVLLYGFLAYWFSESRHDFRLPAFVGQGSLVLFFVYLSAYGDLGVPIFPLLVGAGVAYFIVKKIVTRRK